MFTCIVTVFNASIDYASLIVMVLMSQKIYKLINVLLKNFHALDEQLSASPKSKAGLLVVLTASVYVTKIYYLVSRYDNFRISFNVGARFSYGMTIVTEQLISLMCMEIKSRYKILHLHLKSRNGCCSLGEVRALHSALIFTPVPFPSRNACVRKFLLADISQMVMLITSGILNVFLVCLIPKEGEEQKSIGWCAVNGMFAADCTWRLCFLVHNCGALQSEA